jgi:hypothetical protein
VYNETKDGRRLRTMECKHEQVECTNGIVRCLGCGRELPIEFLTGSRPSEEEKPKKTPRKPSKKEEN